MVRKAWRSLVMLLVGASLIVACAPGATPGGTDSSATPTQPDAPQDGESDLGRELEQGSWILQSYGPEEEPQQPLPGTTLTATFDNGEVAGNAGCNQYGGRYQVNGQEIVIGEIVQTEMACLGDGIMEQESTFLTTLQLAERFAVDGDTLTIWSGAEVLRFTQEPEEEALSLEGPSWQLETVVTGDVASSTIRDSAITATFSEGRIAGSAGCNDYFAEYVVSGEEISVGEIGATKKLCADEVMKQEQSYFDALRSAERFTITGTQLMITHPAGSLLFQPSP